MVSKIQWKPFWLATQLYPQNDWTGWQNDVNDDVCVQASLSVWGSVMQQLVQVSPVFEAVERSVIGCLLSCAHNKGPRLESV